MSAITDFFVLDMDAPPRSPRVLKCDSGVEIEAPGYERDQEDAEVGKEAREGVELEEVEVEEEEEMEAVEEEEELEEEELLVVVAPNGEVEGEERRGELAERREAEECLPVGAEEERAGEGEREREGEGQIESDLDEHWSRVLLVSQHSPALALFLCEISTCPVQTAVDSVFTRGAVTEGCMSGLVAAGFEPSIAAVGALLSETGELARVGDELRACLGEEMVGEAVEAALVPLFRDGRAAALRKADALIETLKVPESRVARALFASPADLTPGAPLVLLTRAAHSQRCLGGGASALWQFVLARYGPDHAFTAACLHDLVVSGCGGTDADDDTEARDVIDALIEAGAAFDPATVGPVARSVIETRTAPARQIEWLARIERGLLRSRHHALAPDESGRCWSRTRWVAALRRHVLSHPAFAAAAAAPTPGAPGATSVLSVLLRSIALAPQMAHPAWAVLRRFCGAVAALVDLLESRGDDDGPQRENTRRPFQEWIEEIDRGRG
ncbi:hypothetical protein BDK51DRAFT_45858 [Blyttiomyces helicus]|uniref:Uncharacterized protein n=1 Tax=Blyttiomyces helicus TaxID=388810 RepID=A0A4P9WGG9_9FUNG|nr:hypothetical protein BDK51DRAFT_45858 [Blyttiomyces helicus]|eukprot:RKO91911.1 hypothetical protein BDK51DRAFT_45858 [Blyttiomyces helicus]